MTSATLIEEINYKGSAPGLFKILTFDPEDCRASISPMYRTGIAKTGREQAAIQVGRKAIKCMLKHELEIKRVDLNQVFRKGE
jgi:hypothetical protein